MSIAPDPTPGRTPGLRDALGREQVLVDLGTTTVTAVSAFGAPGLADAVGWVGHPVLQTLPLAAEDTTALGSDFTRAGFLFERPAIDADDVFTDGYGIDWLVADGGAAPLEHPLQAADQFAVARYPRPVWPHRVQPGGPGLVVADAPTSGIVETCFSLRNSWQFLIDITEDWRAANALLDWALESVATAYEEMLGALPTQPDVVLYGDDYGYQGGMFLSDEDFRTFVRPRLRTLMSRIRRATPAAICFHCCGAVHPILADLADLGVEMLNLQSNAKGMGIDAVRRTLPSTVLLHGYTDLRLLGAALLDGDRRTVALLTDELMHSAPAIAAPVDNLPGLAELQSAATGARFVRALTGDDLADLRRMGPVVAIIDRAAALATAVSPLTPAGHPPEVLPVPADGTTINTAPASSPVVVSPGRKHPA